MHRKRISNTDKLFENMVMEDRLVNNAMTELSEATFVSKSICFVVTLYLAKKGSIYCVCLFVEIPYLLELGPS